MKRSFARARILAAGRSSSSRDGFRRSYCLSRFERLCRVVTKLRRNIWKSVPKEPRALLPLILNAGAVFLEKTPERFGGLPGAGPNHVLPTSGTWLGFFSPLSVDSFLKTMSVLEYSRENLQQQWKQIAAFANAESLTAHANSIEVRFEDETD